MPADTRSSSSVHLREPAVSHPTATWARPAPERAAANLAVERLGLDSRPHAGFGQAGCQARAALLQTMSLRFFKARTVTFVEAGLAGRS